MLKKWLKMLNYNYKINFKELKCDDEKAFEYLKMLKKEKRYLLDVY